MEVIGSPCSRIIGKIIQNPGDREMYITYTAKLRFDTAYNINNLRIEQNRRMHNNSWSMTLTLWCLIGQLACARSSDTEQIFRHRADLHDDWPIFTSSCAIHANAFKPSIKHWQKLWKFSLILPSLDFAATSYYYYTQHGCCRLLADGEGIFFMEYHHSFTPVLDRGPRSSHPW